MDIYYCMQPDLLCDDDEINQAVLWVEGRKTKEGIPTDNDLATRVSKIVSSILILF